MYVNIYLKFLHLSDSMIFGIFGHTYSATDSDVGYVEFSACVYRC